MAGTDRVSRRRVLGGVAKAGVVAGAAAWAAPQLSSVALAQSTAGSPPPPTTEPTEVTAPPIEVSPGVVGRTPVDRAPTDPGGAPGIGVGGAQADPGGTLPFTGSSTKRLAATGAAAVATGSALIAADRVIGRREQSVAPAQSDPGAEDAS